jgi:hypothetical protein
MVENIPRSVQLVVSFRHASHTVQYSYSRGTRKGSNYSILPVSHSHYLILNPDNLILAEDLRFGRFS